MSAPGRKLHSMPGAFRAKANLARYHAIDSRRQGSFSPAHSQPLKLEWPRAVGPKRCFSSTSPIKTKLTNSGFAGFCSSFAARAVPNAEAVASTSEMFCYSARLRPRRLRGDSNRAFMLLGWPCQFCNSLLNIMKEGNRLGGVNYCRNCEFKQAG
jgi:hypothetical protein